MTLLSIVLFLFVIVLQGCINNDHNETISSQPEQVSGFVSAGRGFGNLNGYAGTYGNYGASNFDQYQATLDEKESSVTPDGTPREIEEADIVKVDDSAPFLYILNEYRGLLICNISEPDVPLLTGRISITGTPEEMYIRDNLACIIVTQSESFFYARGIVDQAYVPEEPTSRVVIVDITDKAHPLILGSHNLEGEVTDSRIVGSILYVVSTERPLYWIYAVDETTENGDPSEEGIDTTGVYVASLDLSDPEEIGIVDREDFCGTANFIHVSEDAIFVGSEDVYETDDRTTVTYVDIGDPAGSITRRGSITLPGSIMDEFKMDYFEGTFRICTYEWMDGGISNLFIVDTSDPDNLQQIGSVELGRGEQLFATRFDGTRAYMVTYEQKDPLWVIDLSNPANPAIKGELIVPGWSTHIEPRGDRLIALGVDDTEGWRVSVSIFDVMDANVPQLIERISFGDQNGWSTSVAYEDIHAFTILDDEEFINDNPGLILLPYTTYGYLETDYSSQDRLQLIDYTSDDLTARGWVSQKGSVLRSRGFAGRLFSVSSNELQVIDASDRDNPSVTASLPLACNIVDLVPLQNGYGVQVITEDYCIYTMRAVSLATPNDGQGISELSIDTTGYPMIVGNGNLVYIMGNATKSYDATRIWIYDFSDAANPRLRGSLDVPGNYSNLKPLDGGRAYYPLSGYQEIIQLRDDVLVFNHANIYYYPVSPYGSYDTDSIYIDGNESLTVADYFCEFIIVDLSDPDNPFIAANIPVKDGNPQSLLVQGNTLCFTYSLDTSVDNYGRPQIRYYLGRIDLSDPVNPLESDPVNIPGICIGFDESGDVVYTVNNEWTNNDSYVQDYSFNSVRIEGADAILAGRIELPYYWCKAVIEGESAYLSGTKYSGFYSYFYGGSSSLTVIDLTDPGYLISYEHDLATNSYMDLMGVKSGIAFLCSYGWAGCYDLTVPSRFILTESQTRSCWTNNISFSEDKAYIPMGYHDLWVKDLCPP